MLVDTASNLGLTIADGAAPEQIAHQIANSTHERMVDDLQYEGRTTEHGNTTTEGSTE